MILHTGYFHLSTETVQDIEIADRVRDRVSSPRHVSSSAVHDRNESRRTGTDGFP